MGQVKAVRTATRRRTAVESPISRRELLEVLRLERERAVIETLSTVLQVLCRSHDLVDFRKKLTKELKDRSEAECVETSVERIVKEITSSLTTSPDEKPRWTGL